MDISLKNAPRYLTKSRFKLGLDCPNKLYYTRKEEYPNLQEEDTFLESLAQGGFQVEELARMHYPGGVLIEGEDWNYDGLVAKTDELLKQENVIIYEAAFKFNTLFIRTDILVKKGDKIELIEVKAKSFHPEEIGFVTQKGLLASGWVPYLFDLAFQKHVIQNSRPTWKVSAFFMMADKSKHASVSGLNGMFQISKLAGNRTGIIKNPANLTLAQTGAPVLCTLPMNNVLDIIYAGTHKVHYKTFYELIKWFSDHYSADKKINSPVGWHCRGCEYHAVPEDGPGKKSGFEECWGSQKKFSRKDLEKPSTFDIWNFRKGRGLLEDHSKIFMDEITKEDVGLKTEGDFISTSERHMIQIEKTLAKDQTPHVHKEGLQTEMKKWNFPLHFIDFETSAVALPFMKGMRPYEQVVFQYSHHTLHEDGRTEHAGEFISNTPGEFPNFHFIRALKKSLEKDSGSIFKYATHENTMLNNIYDQLRFSKEADKDELMAFIQTISHSSGNQTDTWQGERDMVDLRVAVVKYYYQVKMGGGNGLKAVLPAILESSKYLQQKYSQPISTVNVTSLNFPKTHVWLKNDEAGEVISPYKMLPPLFEGWEQLDRENTVSEIEGLADGGAALTAYAKLQYTVMGDKERKEVTEALLKYCELDTLAMVMVYEALRECVV